jgi:hypothetical protein
MAQIQMHFYKCGKCNSAVDLRIFGFSSILGPPAVNCPWCKEPVQTERLEWDDMAVRSKVAYVVISVVYMAIIGLLGGLSVDSTVSLYEAGHMATTWGFERTTFWVGFGCWAALTALLQSYRYVCSRRRTRLAPGQPLSRGYLNLQVSMQGKVLALLFITPLAAWLIHLVRGGG